MTKKRVEHQTEVVEWLDIFQGAGDFEPTRTEATRYETRLVEVKPPTKPQRKKLIQRLIDKLDPPHPVIAAQKPKPVKRAPKKKKTPPLPKKGKVVAKANEVCLKSPFTGEPQWMPLVPSLEELLAEGWVIVDGDMPLQEAYEFLNFNPEVQGA